MPILAASPPQSSRADAPDVVTFEVRIAGKELSPNYEIAGISVWKEVNRIATAKVHFLDGDPATQDFPLAGEKQFAPGTEIEIAAGYHNHEQRLFRGIIYRRRISAPLHGPSQFMLECKDRAVALTQGRKSAYYSDTTDAQVMEQLLGDLDADVEATDTMHDELVQFHCSDWDFLVSRAEANGQVVIVSDGAVAVRKPSADGSASLTLTYGQNLLEIEVEEDGSQATGDVSASAWDSAEQSVTPGGSSGEDDIVLRHAGARSPEELEAWSDAYRRRARLARIRGRAKVQGTADVLPGDAVELAKVGGPFEGPAYVAGVCHEIFKGDWRTDIQFGLSPEWFSQRHAMADTPAAGLLPAVAGLQIGVVTQIEDDPRAEFRVQVRMPLVDNSAEGVWARVARLDAGENRGTFFLPEVGDEVVLGFLHEDPRDPIILGMLHSSAKPAPIEATQENTQKGIVTRGGIKLLFDDEKGSVELTTPGGIKFTQDDDAGECSLVDANDNSLTMSADGLVIQGGGHSIELSSSGITMESSAAITLKAGGDVKLEGANVHAAAQAQFKATGNAGAEVSTTAIAVLKGSLVRIN